MSTIGSIAQRAYLKNLDQGETISTKTNEKSFVQTIKESLEKVNELQMQKDEMIKEFAVGKSQNVHELMIAIQKASIAVKLTTAIRNKVLEAYKQMMNMPI